MEFPKDTAYVEKAHREYLSLVRHRESLARPRNNGMVTRRITMEIITRNTVFMSR
jgi:hypothetical protein